MSDGEQKRRGRKRRRFCIHGHDKEAPGGSYFSWTRTDKGLYHRRECKLCNIARRKGVAA